MTNQELLGILRQAKHDDFIGVVEAEKCSCGDQNCRSWFLNFQGANGAMGEMMALGMAYLLNNMEEILK